MKSEEIVSINMCAAILRTGIHAIENKWSEDPEVFKKRVREVLKVFGDTANDLQKLVDAALPKQA